MSYRPTRITFSHHHCLFSYNIFVFIYFYLNVFNSRLGESTVSVEFYLVFTRYLDTLPVFDQSDLVTLFGRRLTNHNLGMFIASMKGFTCREIFDDGYDIGTVQTGTRIYNRPVTHYLLTKIIILNNKQPNVTTNVTITCCFTR